MRSSPPTCKRPGLIPGVSSVLRIGRTGCLRAFLRPEHWLGLVLLLAGQQLRAAPGFNEYQIKATYLFNFVKFTEWPSPAYSNAAAPLIIGVLGDDPFDGVLEAMVKDEQIGGRRLVVKQCTPGEDLSGCHVLFISRSEKRRVADVLAELKQKPVFTVSDQDRFCQKSGMVNLVLSDKGTIQPEINLEATRAAGIRLSSKLLNLPMMRFVKTEP